MIIRQGQMTALSQVCRRDFEDSMASHLRRCFPRECKQLGEKKTKGEIRYGIDRASAYGIALERDVCKYIDLMFVYGRDFDRDPGLPWASRILEDVTFPDATTRTERLFGEAKHQMTNSAGSTLQ